MSALVRKIQLVSNCIEYGLPPAPEDEVEQHITLLSDGRVWLNRYRYGSGYKYEVKSRETFRIHTAAAAQIMQAIEKCFNDYEPMTVTDVGIWELSITYKNGDVRKLTGSLCRDDRIDSCHLSRLIYMAFDREDLLLFDGRSFRKPNELIFCSVRFDNSSRTYCYLADKDEYEAGDQVVVPAGEDDREAVVEIESIQYLLAEKAPYPLDKIKHVIRKYDRNDPAETIRKLEKEAYAPFETISRPTVNDWKKAYDALLKLADMKPGEGLYPNLLGRLCYDGRHVNGMPQFEEARKWYEIGAKQEMIESMYMLADMLLYGLGGDKDEKRAADIYSKLYWYCRYQFEKGKGMNRFAEVALRVGRMLHEGKAVEKDDLLALNYLLEARFAIAACKQAGDADKKKQDIESVIESCEKPPEELHRQELIGMAVGRVPELFLFGNHILSVRLAVSEDGILRLHFARKNADHPDKVCRTKVLWAVAPTQECFLTDSVTLYGTDVQMIWNQTPGEEILCDRYEYDEKHRLHKFCQKDQLVCRLMGGRYYLYMSALRPGMPERPMTQLEPFRQKIYDIARTNEQQLKGHALNDECPLCGQKTLTLSIVDGRLFAVCVNCSVMTYFPWPEEKEERGPFDLQREWKDV